MFIEGISKKNKKDHTSFYEIYEEFNNDNKWDLFDLDQNLKKYDLLPIVILYRNL